MWWADAAGEILILIPWGVQGTPVTRLDISLMVLFAIPWALQGTKLRCTVNTPPVLFAIPWALQGTGRDTCRY